MFWDLKKLFVFVILFSIPVVSTKAALETDTHIYILAHKTNCVVAINRTTGKETLILVGDLPMDMQLYKDRLYVVNSCWSLSVINTATNTLDTTIVLRTCHDLRQMVIYEENGYVLDGGANLVMVIDLLNNKVIQKIQLSASPEKMFLYNDRLYVQGDDSISVIDLAKKCIVNIVEFDGLMGEMVIAGDRGFTSNYLDDSVINFDLTSFAYEIIQLEVTPFQLLSYGPYTLFVTDLSSQAVVHIDTFFGVSQSLDFTRENARLMIKNDLVYTMGKCVRVFDPKTLESVTTFVNPFRDLTSFSDTHLYADRFKIRPLYPTIDVVKTLMQRVQLRDFVTIMPKVFEAGDMMRRLVPTRDTVFDTLPLYVVMDTLADWQDPRDVLSVLVTMKNPKKLMDSQHGKTQMMPKVYTALFQAVWTGDQKKARQMILDLIRLEDPVITPLASYAFTIGAGLDTGMKGARGKRKHRKKDKSLSESTSWFK